MMRNRLFHAFVLVSLSTALLEAATPLDRVRKDAGLCVVIDDLPGHVRELKESALRERVNSLTLFRNWKESDKFQAFQGTLNFLNSSLGHPLPDALQNLAGDQLVLAVYPSDENEPAGVLLSSPRDHDLAVQTVEFWNRIEKPKLTQHESGYWRREAGKTTLFYLLTKTRFALSDREALIREIALSPEIPRGESIHDAPGWHRAQDSLDDRSWIRVWFRPEIWPAIRELPEEKPGLEMLLGQLKRAESVILEIDSEAGIHGTFRLLYRSGAEPVLLSDYRTQYPAASGILDRPSPDSLCYIAGRGGFAPAARLLSRGWPDPQSKELRYFRTFLRGLLQNLDPYDDVLPHLGDSWAIDIRPADDAAAFPVDLLLSIALNNGDRHSDVPLTDRGNIPKSSLAAALENLLSTGLRFFRDFETDSRGDLKTMTLDAQTQLTVYQSISGWEPSFLVDEQRVLISSSEQRLRDAVDEAARGSSASETLFQGLSDRPLSQSQAGLLFNLETLRTELASRGGAYLKLFQIARHKRTDALGALALAANSLQLFDGGYLLWNCGEGEWSLHFGATLRAN